jgi:hypothetical protein
MGVMAAAAILAVAADVSPRTPPAPRRALARAKAGDSLRALACASAFWVGLATAQADGLDLATLRNPVWSSTNNLRDPSVVKTAEGYQLYYSRLAGPSADPRSWTVACVTTRDFIHFDGDHDVSPIGHASPGDVVRWHGRWVLPYQSYPAPPVRLCFSESTDRQTWSKPKTFLEEAAQLPWNGQQRVIDPTLVVDGESLHCFFVGSAFHKDDTGNDVRANLMGHAITRDPKLKNWEILTRSHPLINWSDKAPDGVENTMVFKTGDHWTMIYSEGLANQHLALATSRDLLAWESAGPISIPCQFWMSRKFGAPFVWREDTRWLMILMGTNRRDRTAFGLLTSVDGKGWALLPERSSPQ